MAVVAVRAPRTCMLEVQQCCSQCYHRASRHVGPFDIYTCDLCGSTPHYRGYFPWKIVRVGRSVPLQSTQNLSMINSHVLLCYDMRGLSSNSSLPFKCFNA
eukprot:6165886-Amphidinium_carterae.1